MTRNTRTRAALRTGPAERATAPQQRAARILAREAAADPAAVAAFLAAGGCARCRR